MDPSKPKSDDKKDEEPPQLIVTVGESYHDDGSPEFRAYFNCDDCLALPTSEVCPGHALMFSCMAEAVGKNVTKVNQSKEAQARLKATYKGKKEPETKKGPKDPNQALYEARGYGPQTRFRKDDDSEGGAGAGIPT